MSKSGLIKFLNLFEEIRLSFKLFNNYGFNTLMRLYHFWFEENPSKKSLIFYKIRHSILKSLTPS